MRKPRSRLEKEAFETQKKAVEVDRKIKELSTQISNPDKYFRKKSDERTQSTVERFHKYFTQQSVTVVEKRKPTRKELRAERNRAVLWALIALLTLMWLAGKFKSQIVWWSIAGFFAIAFIVFLVKRKRL